MAPISRCVTDEPRPRFHRAQQAHCFRASLGTSQEVGASKASLMSPFNQSLSSLVANCSSLSSGLLRLPYKYYLPP
jgi:hypothetical protein